MKRRLHPSLRLSRRHLSALFVLLPSLACSGGQRAGGAVKSTHSLTGTMAPAFQLEPIGGGTALGPATFAGRVVLVDFWATWCEPCRESFPAYQQLADKFGERLAIIGVSVDEDPEGIAAFRSETQVKFPLVWDRSQSVANSYKPAKMPTSYVIDAKGLIVHVHEGYRQGDHAEIERVIADLLK